MNTEQLRAEFEAWCETRSLEVGRDNEGDYISLETYLSWEGYQAGRASLQSQDREGIIKAARAAMNESFEVGDEYGSIGIPSDRADYLSLLLNEYDHDRRAEGEGG